MTDIISQLFGDDEYAYPHTAHIWDWCLYMQKKEDEARQRKWEEYQAAYKKRRAEYRAKREAKLATAWSMEKQRRSRMDWSAILPRDIASRQEEYERFTTIVRMKEVGLTYREIGERLGLSVERSRHLYCKGTRIRNHPAARKYGSPAERFMCSDAEFKSLKPRGKLIAKEYLSQIASMDRYDSKRDWLFIASR